MCLCGINKVNTNCAYSSIPEFISEGEHVKILGLNEAVSGNIHWLTRISTFPSGRAWTPCEHFPRSLPPFSTEGWQGCAHNIGLVVRKCCTTNPTKSFSSVHFVLAIACQFFDLVHNLCIFGSFFFLVVLVLVLMLICTNWTINDTGHIAIAWKFWMLNCIARHIQHPSKEHHPLQCYMAGQPHQCSQNIRHSQLCSMR